MKEEEEGGKRGRVREGGGKEEGREGKGEGGTPQTTCLHDAPASE